MKNKPDHIRPDLEKCLRERFPDNELIVSFDSEDSYFSRVYEKLRQRLAQLKDAEIVYERDCNGLEESPWIDSSSDPSRWDEEEEEFLTGPTDKPQFISYHSFFLALKDEKFVFTSEEEEEPEEENSSEPADNGKGEEESLSIDEGLEPLEAEDAEFWEEEDEEHLGEGEGRIGCLIAVSLIAPVALVNFDIFETFESGDYSVPDIDLETLGVTGTAAATEQFFRETMGEEALQALQNLLKEITAILDRAKIEFLPAEEAQKVVPWLAPGDAGTILPNDPVTVQKALFFKVF